MESFYTHWLNNGSDFATGVEFYSRHGSSETLKNLFASGANDFTSRKLNDELEKLKHLAFKPIENNRARPKIDRNKLPSHLQKEYDRLSEIIRQMSYKHPQLNIITDKFERANISADILSLAEERRSIFNRLDHFIATGQDLVRANEKAAEIEEKESSPLQLKEELLRLRAQRSKLKKKPNRVSDYNSVCARIKEIEEMKKNG